MKNDIKESKKILLFLALFAFGLGLFSNYRELWMNANGIEPTSISRVISIASVITVLTFLMFTIKVTSAKLKKGILICLILKIITSLLLFFINNSGNLFLIKFLLFFDIAFEEIILGSIYPFIMQITKSDLVYTKRNVVESLGNKIGFLVASIIIGKHVGNILFNYNMCLLLSIIFITFSLLVLINIRTNIIKDDKEIDLFKFINYFKKNKVLILFVVVSVFCSLTYSSITGMTLISLTKKVGLTTRLASFIVLALGLLTNILAIIIVKYFRSKNDHVNLFFKYGIRMCLFFLLIFFNSQKMLLITFIYLLLSNKPYSFIFASHFMHIIKEEYSLLFSIIKYCANLLGTSIGVFICGLTFNLEIKYIGLTTFVISVISYILCTILVNKKKNLVLYDD